MTVKFNTEFKLTPKRVTLAVALSLLFILQAWGQVRLGKWTILSGTLFGVVAVVLSCAAAFTERRRTDRKAQSSETISPEPAWLSLTSFRDRVAFWCACVIFFLLLFKLLDALRAPWRHYFH